MTPEEQELVLGVRMLARSMARRMRPVYPLETDDLEQAAILELCRRLPTRDRCKPFEWTAWYAFRSGIEKAQVAATWRRESKPIVDRALAYGIDVSQHPAAEMIEDVDEVDGCVICGQPMPGRLTAGRERLYCSAACRYRLYLLRAAVSDAA